MPPRPRGVLLTLACLWGTSALAQPREPEVRCLELEAESPAGAREVGLSPELPTTLLFDSALVREAVELEEREHFAFVDVGERSLVLQPSARQRSDKPLRLEVRFQDGQRAALVLVLDSTRAEGRVRVLRQGRCTEEPVKEEVARLQEENQRLRAELARRSEAPGPVSLIQWRTEGRNEAGVTTRDIHSDLQHVQGTGLEVWDAFCHRARGRAAVELVLLNTGTAGPWSADEATLVGPGGETLEVLSMWTTGPIAPGSRGEVMVEAAGEPGPGNHTLRLWKRDGGSVLILGPVKFPQPVRPRPGGRP